MLRLVLLVFITMMLVTVHANQARAIRGATQRVGDVVQQAEEAVRDAISDVVSEYLGHEQTEFKVDLSVQNATKSDLFAFTKDWLTTTFAETQSTIESYNAETGLIVVRYLSHIEHGVAEANVFSTMNILVKDGNVNFEVNNLPGTTPQITTEAVHQVAGEVASVVRSPQQIRGAVTEAATEVGDAIALDLTRNREVVDTLNNFVKEFDAAVQAHAWRM
jgi:hypothetical protein